LTTFAYRNGILVADSMVSVPVGASGYSVGTAKKVLKTKQGWLVGGAGNLVDLHRFFRWVEEGMEEDAGIKMANINGIVVKDKNTILQVEDELYPYVIDAEFYAGGGGEQFALGAMAMGASAEEAVKVAMKFSLGTGGKLQKVSL
jgi:hypothetical protein